MVSIIIPVYNGEKYIQYALNSCIKQTYQNIEIIVIDDGSTDKTKELIKNYQQDYNNLLLIEQPTNKGVSSARNKGIEKAHGEWIFFLDVDDELFPNSIENLISVTKTLNPNIVIGKHITFTQRQNTHLAKPLLLSEIIVWNGKQGLEKHLMDAPELYSACGKLYKSEFIKEIKFLEGHKVHEDSFFNFTCCLKEPKIAITENAYYKCFLSQNSASRSFFTTEKYDDILYFTEEKSRIIKENFPEYIDKIYNLIIKSRLVFLWNTASRFDSSAKEIQKEAKKTIKKYKKYFIPATKQDSKMFLLVKYNLYGFYQLIRILKKPFVYSSH